jgi:predicted nucleic acid-binding protein
MVLAAGLTSKREPASHSRRLLDLAANGRFDLVITDTLLAETFQVLVDPKFIGRLEADDAAGRLSAIADMAAVHIRDLGAKHPALTADPDDDYLAAAALATGAFLVTRDDRADFSAVVGLRVGRPGTALRLLGAIDSATP